MREVSASIIERGTSLWHMGAGDMESKSIVECRSHISGGRVKREMPEASDILCRV